MHPSESLLPTERIEALLDAMRRVRVLVVGDLMLDTYLRGAASRISPEAPVPVVRVFEEWAALGGAANVAANLVALGARCSLVGCIGEDVAGRTLRAALRERGIGDAGVLAQSARPTTVKTRVLVRHQQVARYDREVEDDVGAETAAELGDRVEAAAADCDVIVLEDYDKGVLVSPVIEAALDLARRRGRPVVVDPKARHFFDYRGATLFKPNLAELAGALRAPVLHDDASWMQRTRRHLDCSHLLLTLGEAGMALATEDGRYHRLPSLARSVYDVSGAGDTVTAAVAAAVGAGATPLEAAALANYAAGIEVGKAGVATVAPEEILAAARNPEINT